jgi:hypothetical protein
MSQAKDQLVDEETMEKMSVAPPDPETEAQADGSPSGAGKGRAEPQSDGEAVIRDNVADGPSGVADQDPLSAHPS